MSSDKGIKGKVNTMKKVALKGALAIILILAAVTAGIVIRNGKIQRQQAEVAADVEVMPEEEMKAVNVAVRVLEPETVAETFALPGTLEAWEEITLSLEQPGPIVWIGPSEGDRLAAGDEVLRIDKEALIAQHAKNQTNYDIRYKQLDRAESLLREQLISERERDEVYQAFQAANASLTETKIALQKSTLVSPIDGILDKLFVDRGEYGTVGTPAAVVVKVDKLKVLVDVPEKDVPYIKTGQGVTVLPAGLNGKGIGRRGKVIYVSYLASEMTRTYSTKVEIGNTDGFLRPGMIVRVKFVRRVITDALVVPLYAVIDREGQKFVFVVENDAAVIRQVRLGPIVNGSVVVFGGIQAGEQLVVKGQQLLADGGPVRIVEE